MSATPLPSGSSGPRSAGDKKLLRADRHVDRVPGGGGVEKTGRRCPDHWTPHSLGFRAPPNGGVGWG